MKKQIKIVTDLINVVDSEKAFDVETRLDIAQILEEYKRDILDDFLRKNIHKLESNVVINNELLFSYNKSKFDYLPRYEKQIADEMLHFMMKNHLIGFRTVDIADGIMIKARLNILK